MRASLVSRSIAVVEYTSARDCAVNVCTGRESMNWRSLFYLIAVVGMALLFAIRADAACPSPFTGLACDGGSTNDIVDMISSTEWECDLTNNGDNQRGQITIVAGYSAYDYNAWGQDAAGNNYCCEYTDSSITTVTARGGSYADDINFRFDSGGTAYNGCDPRGSYSNCNYTLYYAPGGC